MSFWISVLAGDCTGYLQWWNLGLIYILKMISLWCWMSVRQMFKFLWEVIIFHIDVDGLFEYAAHLLKPDIHRTKNRLSFALCWRWACAKPGWGLSFPLQSSSAGAAKKLSKISLCRSLKSSWGWGECQNSWTAAKWARNSSGESK